MFNPLGECAFTECAHGKRDQRDACLHRGEQARRLCAQRERCLSALVAELRHVFKANFFSRNQSDFAHSKQAIQQNEPKK